MLRSRAAASFQDKGYPPLKTGETIFAIGDIHGRLDLLEALHEEIDAARRQLTGPVVEIYLGDYVDRGPDAAGVVERLIQRESEYELVLLRGNHEVLFQQALDGALDLREWARFGGLQTLQSYGVEPSDWLTQLRERVPASHASFVRRLFDCAWRGDYFFVHAGVRPGVPLNAQMPDDLYWIRREFLDNNRDHGAVVVHGHTLAHEPELHHNRINLDTGAFVSGRLSCLRIDGGGARLFGGAAGFSAPILAPESKYARNPGIWPGEDLRIRFRQMGTAVLQGWRPRKAATPSA